MPHAFWLRRTNQASLLVLVYIRSSTDFHLIAVYSVTTAMASTDWKKDLSFSDRLTTIQSL
jgi:Zn-finger domain-containing protein